MKRALLLLAYYLEHSASPDDVLMPILSRQAGEAAVDIIVALRIAARRGPPPL